MVLRIYRHVGIDEEQDVAGSDGRAAIARMRRAAVLPLGLNHLRAILPRDFGRLIGGAVIHHNDLRRGVIRIQNGAQNQPQHSGAIVDGNDD